MKLLAEVGVDTRNCRRDFGVICSRLWELFFHPWREFAFVLLSDFSGITVIYKLKYDRTDQSFP